MDCFYAAVEVLDQPELRGKPVIVGGRERRGVVSAANYEARAYGVKSAMPITTALKLCKKAINVPVRMARYKEISIKIHEIFLRFTDKIQPISLDEAFLDVTENKKNTSYATPIAREIKAAIIDELGLIASAGVAPNRFLAKIASDYDKPNGLYVIKPHQVNEFMKQLPVKRIWGVGRVMGKALDDLGIHFASDVQKYPLSFLEKKFGKMGPHLLELSQGIDHSEVKPYGKQKTIGKETTFTEDVFDRSLLCAEIDRLSLRVMDRLKVKGYVVGGVTLKIKYANFKLVTRSKLLESKVISDLDLSAIAKDLMGDLDISEIGVRLVGISAYKISPMSEASSIFDWMNE